VFCRQSVKLWRLQCDTYIGLAGKWPDDSGVEVVEVERDDGSGTLRGGGAGTVRRLGILGLRLGCVRTLLTLDIAAMPLASRI